MDILFWLMDHSYQELLMNELNEYLTNKNPKVRIFINLDYWIIYESYSIANS